MENKLPKFTLAHVGVNAEDEKQALAIAQLFAAAFDLPVKVGNSSIFAGTAVEVMKQPYLGRNGHIAFGTDDPEGAVAALEAKGILFDKSTAKYKDNALTAIYLQEEIGGFAVHIVRSK